MKILILLNEPYPYGMACTNRIHLYAKGLIASGQKTEILIPKPKTQTSKEGVAPMGTYEGVPYRYSTKSAYRSSSFFIRRWTSVTGPLNAALHCFRAKPDIMLMVGGKYPWVILFYFVKQIIKSKFYREKSEIPYMEKESVTNWQKQFLRHSYSFFDGIITISDNLADYFKTDLKLNTKTFTIPILIDPNTQNITKKTDFFSKKKIILYTGSLIDRKDGILLCLKAFQTFLDSHPNYTFVITGNAKHSTDYLITQQFIKEYNLAKHVVFTGFLKKEELNNLMRKASLLLLIKPYNRQNSYNFPTKLGEYLCSNTPVLCSKHPVFLKYLRDEHDIFYTENNHATIAEKMNHIINNPELSDFASNNGIRVALREFNYMVQMKKLNSFFTHG